MRQHPDHCHWEPRRSRNDNEYRCVYFHGCRYRPHIRYADFTALFAIDVSSDQFETIAVPFVDGSPDLPVLALDLDLDVAGGVGLTTFAESFESGFGAFEAMPLDAELNPPDSDLSNTSLGLENADGYRCSYSDPDWENSGSYGTSSSSINCFPNPTTMPDAVWFHLTADRAFQGTMAMHWGSFLDPSRGFTSPLSQLEAIRTSEPINLGWGFVCQTERTIRCESDTDCAVGDECVRVNPVLSFKHQISLMDHRTFGIPNFGSAERAVVQGQLADDEGNPIGDWVKLEPHFNSYETQTTTRFTNCSFDPIDDGNTEDDFFNPSSPIRFFGPSSTCSPELSFVDQGDTGNEFVGSNLGDASEGPGLQGTAGAGTWIEPRINLGHFRGRRVRLRFLATGLKINRYDPVNWDEFWGQFNPDDRDDGWFIDDVAVTDTLAQPATVAVDAKDSTAIKADWDFDGIAAACDCNSDDDTAWTLPGEVSNLLLTRTGGPGGTTPLSWTPPVDIGGTKTDYDVSASPLANDFDSSGFPIGENNGSETSATDGSPLESGSVLYYLVRARNSCGAGLLR